ncbi:MAG: tetratricopeptide repeat protein [Oligoflexia bacterium]|nr:tetratricopeptide repeat protein [Oligoflexia bacterium]
MHDKKLGRNPFNKETKKQPTDTLKADNTVLFQNIIKPSSDLEKLKQMQIQVDWHELYRSITNVFPKLFIFVALFSFLVGCSTSAKNQQVELKKHMVELQKIVAKQTNTIEELNNKIYLLSDRVEHFEKVAPTTENKAPQIKKAEKKAKPGDLKLYKMAQNDLKNNAIGSFEKKLDLLIKGYKDSPLTSNALFQLGEYYYKSKNYLKASETFEKLYDMSPDGNRAVSVLYMLGVNYQKQNRIQEARQAYQTVINIYPGSKEAKESSLKLNQLNRGGG